MLHGSEKETEEQASEFRGLLVSAECDSLAIAEKFPEMAEFEQKIRSRAQHKLLNLNRIIHATRSRTAPPPADAGSLRPWPIHGVVRPRTAGERIAWRRQRKP